MPNILNKEQPIRLVLDCDKDKENAPVFLAKNLTFKESKNLTLILDGLLDSGTEKMFSSLEEVLEELIVGWENMGEFKFGECEVIDVLSFLESVELCHKIVRGVNVEGKEKN